MADLLPFRGVRFGRGRTSLGRLLCPPYDCISPATAARLRRSPWNAIHVEYPEGAGPERYPNAVRTWRSWRASGELLQDSVPAFYVCEETFEFEGRPRRRRGFFAAMSLAGGGARWVVPHERIFAGPKIHRMRLLSSVRTNLSPVLALFPDENGAVHRELAAAAQGRPLAVGAFAPVDSYRLWRLSDPSAMGRIQREMDRRHVLIADGHHRYAAAKSFYARTRVEEASRILTYLCPEEDDGVVVMPTHRVVRRHGVFARASARCRLRRCLDLHELLAGLSASPSPYAFGVYHDGFFLGEPRDKGRCRSGLSAEWLQAFVLAGVAPEDLTYTADSRQAVAIAAGCHGTALLAKPFTVPAVRKAAQAVGLLPPKTTSFFPKIAAGLVFRAFES